MSVINTNVKSLVAQNAIEGNNNRLSTAMQRLSTGLRINSAADDAAGLAISTRMTAQVRGLNMAIKNANDGISLLQTAEGAMDEVTNMVQRIRELAVQAATDTVTDSDREDLNKEVVALQKEINRIASTTQFNGFNILDGSFQNKLLQIGDKAGVKMDVSIKDVSAASLGQQALAKGTLVSGRVNIPAAGLTKNIIINGTAIQAVTPDNSDPVNAVADIKDVVASINASNVGVTASAYNEVVAKNKGTGVSVAGTVKITVTSLDAGVDTEIALGDTTSLQDMVNQINAKGGEDTVLARINEDGKLVLYNNSGATIAIDDTSATIDVNGVAQHATGFDAVESYNGFLKLASNDGKNFSFELEDPVADAGALGMNKATQDGNIVGSKDISAVTGTEIGKAAWLSGSMYINGVDIWSANLDMGSADDLVNTINGFTNQTGVTAGLASGGELTLKSADGSPVQIRLSNAFDIASADVVYDLGLYQQNVGAADFDQNAGSLGVFAGSPSVGSTNVLSQSTATAAIKVMDKALDQISGYRADIGATINRLNSTVTNLGSVVTNTQASRSRILDTDYATETTNLARAQIIQQAATAMLAQANQSAQTVLSLLK